MHIILALSSAKYFTRLLVCKDTGMVRHGLCHQGTQSDKQTNIQTNTQKRISNEELVQNPLLGTSIETGLSGTWLVCIFLIGI